MIKCQNGKDYDISFKENGLNFKTLLRGLRFLVLEENKSYVMFVFSGVSFKHSHWYLKLAKLFPQDKAFNFECFTNEQSIIIEYNEVNIEKIIEIIPEDDKSYEHFFYFNEEETILEYCDVYYDGQMAVSSMVPELYVGNFSAYLSASYSLYEDET
jgi:hypothetical protein